MFILKTFVDPNFFDPECVDTHPSKTPSIPLNSPYIDQMKVSKQKLHKLKKQNVGSDAMGACSCNPRLTGA